MKVLNFGSLNIDKVYRVNEIVEKKETISSLKYDEYIGGKGLNQSIALSKTGVNVFHAGKIGTIDGAPLLEALLENDVNVTYLTKSKNVSGHAIIQVEKSGENAIIIHGGANQEITKDEITDILNEFDSNTYVLLQNEISNVSFIISEAKRREMKVVLNPSPITDDLLESPLELVDLLFLNEIEGNRITNKILPQEILGELRQIYPKTTCVLTLGEDGAIYDDGEIQIKQPAYSVDVVDPTGAGDTFTGFFLGLLVNGYDLKKCMKYSSAASALSVTRHGASNSIPSLKEVEQWIDLHSER